MTFEEAVTRLKELANVIKDENTSLEDAIKCYEEGIACYNQCDKILKDAKQQIDVLEVEAVE